VIFEKLSKNLCQEMGVGGIILNKNPKPNRINQENGKRKERKKERIGIIDEKTYLHTYPKLQKKK